VNGHANGRPEVARFAAGHSWPFFPPRAGLPMMKGHTMPDPTSLARLTNITAELRTLPTRGDSPAERCESAGRLLIEAIRLGAFSGPADTAFVAMVRQRLEQKNVNGWISAWTEAVWRLLDQPKAPRAPALSFPDDCALVADVLDREIQRLERAGGEARIKGFDATPKPEKSAITAPPAEYLASWREILVALGMRDNDEDKQKVARLNKTYDGPITIPGQGRQPFAEKTKLLEWWNGLEAKIQAEKDRQRDTQATVSAQHNYAREGVVAPDIAGGVKKRRQNRKP
jgi:hypothetical protein